MDRRKEVGSFVRARRMELRLSVRAAAMRAGVDRQTWQGLENGARVTQDRIYAAVEDVLQVGRGTLLGMLSGDVEAADRDQEEPGVTSAHPNIEALLEAALKIHGDPREFEALARQVARRYGGQTPQGDDPSATG